VEPLWHTYQIRLDPDATFSVVLDGEMLQSGINAGPASTWNGGIGTGTLFTLANLDDRHLSTAFDNVRSLGLVAGAAHPMRHTTDEVALILSNVFADAGHYNVNGATRGLSVPAAFACRSAGTGEGQRRLSRVSPPTTDAHRPNTPPGHSSTSGLDDIDGELSTVADVTIGIR
jgi:hypothetical protein